jgi:bifunctional enzyme CysN/CysC
MTAGNAAIEEFLHKYENRELLRFLTCGSVDDGKSTLIGRLLHDSQMVYDDQLAAARRDTLRHGTTGEEIDFALLVDGLEAEREQGITIDVAYRYFSTVRRKFIIADTPGHEQYTRNMATGASTCNLAVILVDARRGVLDQTRRHAFITSLLGIKHLVVAINKMDLVEYSQERFEAIRADFAAFAAKLQVTDIEFIPMSALRGENVVHGSANMPWYLGRPLLDFLETVHIASDVNLIDLRLPVQLVLRPNLDFRGYAGTVASGVIRRGDEVVAVPSGRTTRIREVYTSGSEVPEASASMAVVVTLEDELDLSRGDMLAHVQNVPQVSQELEAMLVWMNERPLEPGREYLLKHAATEVPAIVPRVRYRINVNTLRREESQGLALNEIGRVRVETPRRLAFDPYVKNRGTGAFILIDRITNATLAAGMILDREPADTAAEHERGESGAASVIWLDGDAPSRAAVASEIARAATPAHRVKVLTEEDLRGLTVDLGTSPADRREVARRAVEVARLLATAGVNVILAVDAGEDREVFAAFERFEASESAAETLARRLIDYLTDRR